MNLRERAVAFMLIAAIAVPSFSLFFFSPLCDSDVGWHLKFGEYIVRHHAIPTQDVLRFTPQEKPLHLHGWLSQAGFYILEEFGGLELFRLGTSLVMLSTLLLLAHLLFKMNGSVQLTALGVLLFLRTSIHLFHPRARIFTPPLFLLAFEMIGLDAPPLSARRLLGLFLLSVTWMNLHAEASVVPFYIVVLLVSEGLQRPLPRRRVASLALAAVVTAAALFASPLGATWLADTIQNYQVDRANSWEWFTLFDYQKILDGIFANAASDYRPMLVHLLGYPSSLAVTLLIAVAYVVSLALRPARAEGIPGVLVNLWALCLAFNMQRNSWLLFLPIASLLRVAALRLPPPILAGRWQSLTASAGILLLAALTFNQVVHNATWRKYNDDGWDARMFPTKAAAFLQAAALAGNTFSEAEWGGYLAYRRPDSLVFMHGHWAEAPETYADYQTILEQGGGYTDLLERYGVALLVVPPTWGSELPSSQWVEIFSNFQSRIYVSSHDLTRLAAVEAYYRKRGIPFSRSTGFDSAAASAAAPAWAQEFLLQSP